MALLESNAYAWRGWDLGRLRCISYFGVPIMDLKLQFINNLL